MARRSTAYDEYGELDRKALISQMAPTAASPGDSATGGDYSAPAGDGSPDDSWKQSVWYTEQLNPLYQKYYGRDIFQDEYNTHVANLRGTGRGTIYDIERELDADAKAKGLGIYAPAATTPETTPTTPTTPGYDPSSVYGNAALAGWDQTKWGNANHNTLKYLAGRYMSTMTPNEANLGKVAEYLRSLGYTVDYGGSGDTMSISGKDLTSPTTIDALQGLKTGSPQWQWGDVYGGTPAAGAGTTAIISGGTTGGGSGGTTGGGTGGGTASEDYWTGILEQLMKMDPSKVSLDDPTLKAQSDAYRADATRAQRDKRSDLAEYYASLGMGSSGALDADVSSSIDQMGHDIAGHDAELLANEVKSQRDMLMQALTLYGGYLSDQQKNAITLRIAEMQDAISRLQVGYDYDALEATLNSDAMKYLLM